jgi:hypothetical protein
MARRALTGREAGIPRRSAGGSILVMHGRKASPRGETKCCIAWVGSEVCDWGRLFWDEFPEWEGKAFTTKDTKVH